MSEVEPKQPAARSPGQNTMQRSLLAIVAAALVTVMAGGGAVAQPDGPKTTDRRTKPAGTGRKLIVERVVAVVGDAIILESELQARVVPALPDTNSIADPKERARRIQKITVQTLDEMVNEELIVQAANEAKIDIEPGEVDAALEEIRKQNNLDQAQLAAALADQGFTVSAYKIDLRRQLLRLRAVNQLVRPKVSVSDDDVRARYDQMSRRSESVSAVRLAHVLIKLPETPTEGELSAARARAADVIARVQGGEPFAEVAAATSDDTGTKESGGELGWFERGSITPEWETIVFSMAKGEVRGPVPGPQGLHVFYVTEIKRSDMKSFDELKEQIKGELTRREMDKLTGQWIEELRKKAFIDLKL